MLCSMCIITVVEDMYSRTFNNTHIEEDSNIGYFIVSKEILYNIVVSSFHFIPYAFHYARLLF